MGILQVLCKAPGRQRQNILEEPTESCNNLLSYNEQSSPGAKIRGMNIFWARRFDGSEHFSPKKVLFELDLEK